MGKQRNKERGPKSEPKEKNSEWVPDKSCSKAPTNHKEEAYQKEMANLKE
jgi:hypothetical protein